MPIQMREEKAKNRSIIKSSAKRQARAFPHTEVHVLFLLSPSTSEVTGSDSSERHLRADCPGIPPSGSAEPQLRKQQGKL